MATTTQPIHVIGAGLAGSEVALQLAARKIPVRLFEMKPHARTPAQIQDGYAELVCSNSFRSASTSNAVGALKEEMRVLGGALIRIADQNSVPAGDALAVDRALFSEAVTQAIQNDPYIEVVSECVTALPSAEEASSVVVCTGPLTAEGLADAIKEACCSEGLYFYDAIAPIVAADSIDMDQAYFASRYGKGNPEDYLNCPLDREQYEAFVAALLEAEKVTPHAFEAPKYFEGCLPIEVIAERGADTLRFGCMKPVGLDDPRTGKRPYAVVQLRAENRGRTAYNLVGFQTRMRWGAQKEVFGAIPGLQDAEFLRLGQIHRNTYIDAPRLLDEALRLRTAPHIHFAGQITGVEGYVESMACGLLVGRILAADRAAKPEPMLPPTTALGALHRHILGLNGVADTKHTPSNVHWGMVPPLKVRAPKREKKRLYGERALTDVKSHVAALATDSAIR